MARLALALTLAVIASVAVAPGADARRSVPRNFIGASWGGPMLGAPPELQDRQFPKLARSGVETLRAAFFWNQAQPSENGPIDLAASDRLVGLAAARRIEVMPHVIVAPPWARATQFHFAPPADPEVMRPYVKALVERYGPNGSFWTANPQLPKRPIRYWQFWNEPDLQYQWTIPQNVPRWASYVTSLREFHAAVKEADPRAKVVLGGLTNASWVSLNRLYREGVKNLYDVAAIHPYTKTSKGVVELVRRFRAVMRRRGDARKEVFVTELGLPASRNRTPSKNSLQTTDRGMARFLAESFTALARARRRASTRTSRAYWYTWASEYRGNGIFAYSGLFRYAGRAEPRARIAYRSFVRTARRLEGCARTTAGVCR